MYDRRNEVRCTRTTDRTSPRTQLLAYNKLKWTNREAVYMTNNNVHSTGISFIPKCALKERRRERKRVIQRGACVERRRRSPTDRIDDGTCVEESWAGLIESCLGVFWHSVVRRRARTQQRGAHGSNA